MRKLISRHFLILTIVLIGVFLRFFRLGDFPVQLNHDEISQLYDAISIAQTGKDIYGNFLPTIFPSTNDFKSPFYTYATSLTYFILGNKEWIIRVPGAVLGALSVLATYLFIGRLLNNRYIALISALFVAFSPSEVFFSRKSFENLAGVFFILAAFYFLVTYIKKAKQLRFLFISLTLLAMGMYTYFSHVIIIPMLLLIFIVFFRNRFTLPKHKYIPALVFWFVLIIPLLLIIFTNPDSRYRSKTVFITQDLNLGKDIDYGNRYKAILDFSFNRYLDQFNPVYLFADGLDFTNQGFLDVGLLLLIQLPFVIMGIIYLIKMPDYKEERKFLFAWVLIGMLPSGLTFESHSPHRSIMVYTMLIIFSAIGVYWFIKHIQKSRFFLPLISGLILLFSLNLLYFNHMYFVNFPFEKSQYIQYPFKQVALYAWSRYQNFENIIFDPKFGDIEPMIGVASHYYFAYYGNIQPAKFQEQYRAVKKRREEVFDKFSIREVYWPVDRNLKNSLVIVSPWSVPEQDIEDKSKIIKKFYFYNGQLAFYAISL